MPGLLNAQFLLITATNCCLFLVVATWCFLPVFIVKLGGNNIDVGLVMGSIGISSLGSLPLVAPLIDRYGRRLFIVGGILLIGLTNLAFLFFQSYSPLMIVVRLIQGVAFAACFNGCATAAIDLVPPERRAQGIGLFGVSGSLAVAVGPYLGEKVHLTWGFDAYFLLLAGFGLLGFLLALMVKDSDRRPAGTSLAGFFPTARQDGHLAMMTMAAIFGSGFAAMNTFFPLYANSLGLQAGIFFVAYGCSLIAIRVFFGQVTDRANREKIIIACLLGFGVMLGSTSQIDSVSETVLLGVLFGVVQGLSYPTMMARMVDRANQDNRAVVVALYTGSFGIGINVSVLAWGWVANLQGLAFMFLIGGLVMFVSAAVCAFIFFLPKEGRLKKAPAVDRKPAQQSR
ncbi:MAG: MFS transporter [Desulfomonile tiedjei]|nr:MFS transporter [Desulfomonile tiedjei]